MSASYCFATGCLFATPIAPHRHMNVNKKIRTPRQQKASRARSQLGGSALNSHAGLKEHIEQEAASKRTFEDFIPSQVAEIKEAAALEMAAAIRRCPVHVPQMERTIDTAFVGPEVWPASPADPDATPLLMIPSFDSSVLEYRRLYPLLAKLRPTYAMDTVGWGFTDASFVADTWKATRTAVALGPLQKREHLHAFHRQKIGRPAVIVGTSIGGATALDFALNHPEDVAALVLIDAQGFIDGIGPMSNLPRFLSSIGVQVLRMEQLRTAANKMAYFDPDTFATRDVMLCGRLSTWLPGWAEANMAFISSGGYTGIGSRVGDIKAPVLVLWGRHDKILPVETADKFAAALPDATIRYLEASGHSGHLEEPDLTASVIVDFIKAHC